MCGLSHNMLDELSIVKTEGWWISNETNLPILDDLSHRRDLEMTIKVLTIYSLSHSVRAELCMSEKFFVTHELLAVVKDT